MEFNLTLTTVLSYRIRINNVVKILLFLLAYCLISSPISAKKLYKYKNKKGQWYFSDQPPKTDQPVEIRQLKAGTKRYLWLEKSEKKHHLEYFAISNYPGPIEIEIKLKHQQNVLPEPRLPKRFILTSGKSNTLFSLSALNPYQSWGYSLQYQYVIGSPLANHSEQARYLLPFSGHSQFQVSQAFGGEFSHTDKQNYYAVDIIMPVGTPIHAARSGRVIEVNNDYFNSGTKMAYKSRANSIRILHDDGTMAVYAHLALETAQVFTGLRVSAGQLIGYSGNTGFTTGPHLHFAIQVNKGMELSSVPFKFTGDNGISFEPKAGMLLTNN